MSKIKIYDEFVEQYLAKWGEMKYEFDESTYVNTHTPMRFICSKHGEFWKTPKAMMNYECSKCSYEKRGIGFRMTSDEFIKKAVKIHGNKYDYSKVTYEKTKIPIRIVCPVHGDFYQCPNDHLSGRGCPKCKESHLEKKVRNLLLELEIEHICQYKTKWLKKQSLDFYLPSLNMGIECQGKQHFGYGGWLNHKYPFEKIYELDKKKLLLCKNNNIDIIYVIDNGMYCSIPENIEYRDKIIKFKDLKECIIQRQ